MARSSNDGCIEFLIGGLILLLIFCGLKFTFTSFIEYQTSPEAMEWRKTYDPEWQKADAQRELARQMQIQNELKIQELKLQQERQNNSN